MSTSITRGTGRLLLSACLLAATAGTAQAQSLSPAESLLSDAFVFNLGGFILTTDVKAHLNGSSTTNPDIDFNDTFGKGSDATRVRADALWRITPRNHLRFLYFDNSVDRNRVIDRDIHWGDYTFHAGANVDSRTKFTIAELAYEYAFLKEPTYEINGSLGVHYMKLSQQLSGNATFTDANGNVSSAAFTSKNASVPVPLPVRHSRRVGVRTAMGAPRPGAALQGHHQWLRRPRQRPDRGRDLDVQQELRRRNWLQRVLGHRRREQEQLQRQLAPRLFGRSGVPDRRVLG